MGKINVGDVFPTNQGGTVVVLEFNRFSDIVVQHQDSHGHIARVQGGHLCAGRVRNPYFPSVSGVGYVGFGEYNVKEGGKDSPAYTCWVNMLKRCYCEKVKQKHPTYKDCYAVEEWHNFQNFAEWYYSQPNANKKGFHLDKDLRVLGNKVYGPDTCSLVPHAVNCLLTNTEWSGEGLPKGVKKRPSGYQARLLVNNKLKSLGVYKTKEDAYFAYKKAKEEYVKSIAEKYKSVLDVQVYDNLLKWTHEITHR
ncbi:hypothetical protein [Sinomicrobium sp.]